MGCSAYTVWIGQCGAAATEVVCGITTAVTAGGGSIDGTVNGSGGASLAVIAPLLSQQKRPGDLTPEPRK